MEINTMTLSSKGLSLLTAVDRYIDEFRKRKGYQVPIITLANDDYLLLQTACEKSNGGVKPKSITYRGITVRSLRHAAANNGGVSE